MNTNKHYEHLYNTMNQILMGYHKHSNSKAMTASRSVELNHNFVWYCRPAIRLVMDSICSQGKFCMSSGKVSGFD